MMMMTQQKALVAGRATGGEEKGIVGTAMEGEQQGGPVL